MGDIDKIQNLSNMNWITWGEERELKLLKGLQKEWLYIRFYTDQIN